MKIIDILLVEDDLLHRMEIKRTLDKMNILYKLDEAINGEEALKLLQKRKAEDEKLPDVALIDLNMPRMNGFELLTKIRQDEYFSNLKCFVITTSDEKADKEAARKLGIAGYIIKPFTLTNSSSMDAFNLIIDLMNMKSTDISV